jgi:ArsR family transcriptional regulator
MIIDGDETMKKDMAKVFKALSDENRLYIIELLLKGELCGCILIDKLDISQPTLSYHLRILKDANLTTSYRDGNRIMYVVNKEVLHQAKQFIDFYDHMEATCNL